MFKQLLYNETKTADHNLYSRLVDVIYNTITIETLLLSGFLILCVYSRIMRNIQLTGSWTGLWLPDRGWQPCFHTYVIALSVTNS